MRARHGGSSRTRLTSAVDDASTPLADNAQSILAFPARDPVAFPPPDAEEDGLDPMLEAAYDAEDAGELETAVDYFHAILAV